MECRLCALRRAPAPSLSMADRAISFLTGEAGVGRARLARQAEIAHGPRTAVKLWPRTEVEAPTVTIAANVVYLAILADVVARMFAKAVAAMQEILFDWPAALGR